MSMCKLDQQWILLCSNRGRASGSRHDFMAIQAEGALSLVYFVYTLLGIDKVKAQRLH